ncbi:MAG: 30S ribosomal protein S12 methylthiotransferase RimO [Acidimicrobiaceae bacterium TMED130]|nr:MAG: 30S ribosomal protein S12 methylthiotransferase RimO [Acidimicrobiaceae bacterium TMED130]|tara:strand:- start:26548 stop:27786 length:1239 start_codon:yes stop_codon:yes gene_type:complete
MSERYWIETLGCPKNEVDSEKLVGTLDRDGMVLADSPESADLVVVNTCAFIEDARKESIDAIYELNSIRNKNSELVVTGCLAERYGPDLKEALGEDVNAVSGFGVPVNLSSKPKVPAFDLLNLPRPKSSQPWGYVKVAEGCDRICGFCSIPSFRGPQRSRTVESVLSEIEMMELSEVVLVAQDLASYGKDQEGDHGILELYNEVTKRVSWVRLLYLYPSSLNRHLIASIAGSAVPYFDLSLQHVSKPLLRRMRRWGNADKFSETIQQIRLLNENAVFRTNFIVGYPGETEEDHDDLLRFIEQNQIDWCGFFAYSPEEGTYANGLGDHVEKSLLQERLIELSELQDSITSIKRDSLIAQDIEVLVDEVGFARSFREAPEIDGIIRVPELLVPGQFATVKVIEATGTDLVAVIP